jgi:hypothetical protein
MKKLVLFLLFLSFSTVALQAQRKKTRFLDRSETVYGIGFSNFLGELGGRDMIGTNGIRDLEMILTRPSVHLGFRYRKNPILSFKLNLIYGMVAGRDSLTKEPFRRNRNLSFRSPIFETSLQAEISVLQLKSTKSRYVLRGVRGKSGIDLNIYVFGGIGGFYFNPKAKLGGKWWALQPLGTEGQGIAASREPYKRIQACFPVGLGFRLPLSDKNWTIGFEYGVRLTTTDYIDDVSTTYFSPTLISQKYGPVAAQLSNRSNPSSPDYIPLSAATGQQRGDPTDKDSYMIGTITLTYRLKSGRSVLPKFR